MHERLTGLWALVELGHECEGVLDDVQNSQQGAREPKKLAEAVEAKIDQVTSQVDHLEHRGRRGGGRRERKRERCAVKEESTKDKRERVVVHTAVGGRVADGRPRPSGSVEPHLEGQLILLLVSERERLAHHVFEVLLHKLHGGGKLPLHLLPGGVRALVRVPEDGREESP